MKAARLPLLLLIFLLQIQPAMAAPEVGLPSTSTTDGKFLGLAGVGLQTLTQQSKFFIGLSSAETTFSAAIFDGDLGNSWDNHDPLNSVKTEFVLYADPNRTGDTTGKTPLVTRTSDQLTDNAWADLYNGPVHAAARSFSGNYFYFVVVRWTTEAQSANEFNSFKVKATGQLSITPGQWSFVGAPINLTSDPAFGTAGNSYAGAWDWFVYVPPGVSQVNFTECDADARAGTPPGSPPDDETDVRVAIAPDVRYSVLGPTGSLVINQGIPSGNSVCKTGSAPVTTGGVYRWSWVGVDAHNLIFVDLSYETFQAAATPFAIGTASPTPSATATVTPTVAPTGTPGPTNTAVPTVPVPTMTPTRTPQPSTGGEPSRPTNTPAPLLTPRATLVAEGSPTPPPLSPIAASPVPASPFASPVVPRSTPTAVPARPTMTVGGVTIQVPSRLPRTGDLAPIATGLGSVLVLVAGVRFRRRR